ncbi:hypothetical protein ACMFMF_005903 [Clarireedia jacksonii]
MGIGELVTPRIILTRRESPFKFCCARSLLAVQEFHMEFLTTSCSALLVPRSYCRQKWAEDTSEWVANLIFMVMPLGFLYCVANNPQCRLSISLYTSDLDLRRLDI